MEEIKNINNIKIDVWGGLSLNRKQILVLELLFITIFISVTIFLFSYDFKPHLDNPAYTFHAKYAKYMSLLCTFLVIIEAQFFWTQFTKKQLDIIKAQKNELDNSNRKIKQSLNYASNLQRVVLPPTVKLNRLLKEHFILFRPKDMVSGDFYWVEQFGDKTIVAVADCTGHGVPGAFLSAMGISILNEIVLVAKAKQEELTPAKILEDLKYRFQNVAQGTEQIKSIYDGMDISVCIIDKKQKQYIYSGALMSIIHISKVHDEGGAVANKIKSDLLPLSLYSSHNMGKKYTDKIVNYHENDLLYLYSDGYEDQFGGEHHKKFMHVRFVKLIKEVSKFPMSEQLNKLNSTLDKWKKNIQQIDDITVLGIKL